jgi:hypothetical protein
MQVAMEVQVRLHGKTISEILKHYESFVEDALKNSGYGETITYWVAGWEKRKTVQSMIDKTDAVARTPAHRILNQKLIELNATVHSHPYLRPLLNGLHRGFAVFNITPTTRGVELAHIVRPSGEATAPQFPRSVEFAGMNGHECAAACLRDITSGGMNLDRILTDYLDSYSSDRDILERITQQTATVGTLYAHTEDAARHYGLIALFIATNDCTGATYFLSPVHFGDAKSSMIIYWKEAIPERSLLLQLLMVMNLNAAPVLKHQEVLSVKASAFRNAGHLMKNRCSEVATQIAKLKGGADYRHYVQDLRRGGRNIEDLPEEEQALLLAWANATTLTDTFQATRLWGFTSLPEIFQHHEGDIQKNKNYFCYDVEGADLMKLIEEWSFVLRESFRGEPVRVEVTSGSSGFAIVPDIDDECGGKCRLNDSVLHAVFYEVLLNAARHGHLSLDDDSRLVVPVSVSMLSEGGQDYIILTNQRDVDGRDVDNTDIVDSLGGDYRAFPPDSNKGLGMIAAVLSQLQIGSVRHRVSHPFEERGVKLVEYHVAVHLRGLRGEQHHGQDQNHLD